MTTRIWIEPVKRPDGRNWYTDRGPLLRSRLGGPEGEILCDRVHNPVCESCRVLMSRGIVGAFETWKADIPYPCMVGDIASVAALTVHEPDDGVVHFARWRPFHQNAVSRSAVPAPAREEDEAGRGVAADTIARWRVRSNEDILIAIGQIADQSGRGIMKQNTSHVVMPQRGEPRAQPR